MCDIGHDAQLLKFVTIIYNGLDFMFQNVSTFDTYD